MMRCCDINARRINTSMARGTIIKKGIDLKNLFIERYQDVRRGMPKSFGGTIYISSIFFLNAVSFACLIHYADLYIRANNFLARKSILSTALKLMDNDPAICCTGMPSIYLSRIIRA